MRRRALRLGIVLALLAHAAAVGAQVRPAWGRVALFGTNTGTTRDDGSTQAFHELVANVTFESPAGDTVNYEYRADVRIAGYPGTEGRARRVSLYDAYAGVRLFGGRLALRGGQMWLTDLGGLGSVGGGLVEFRQRPRPNGARWRAALFGGLEPRIMEVGYVDQVVKLGGLVAYDGAAMRRHVVGFVHVRDNGLTERSVLSFTNYLPVHRRLFLYQVGEYDLAGPGISGAGSLTYFFVNGRYQFSDRVEFQGLYHRGRSIDQRTIIRDQLDGRPISPTALDGLRFESISGRLNVTLGRGLRLYAGYGQDRNNRDDDPSGRINVGLHAANLLGSGLDLTVSDARMDRGAAGSYDAWYVSLGRSLGARVYLSGDYSSSLSIYRFTSSTGFVIETRPLTRRVAASGLINAFGGTSLLLTLERIFDDSMTQTRLLSGITYRF